MNILYKVIESGHLLALASEILERLLNRLVVWLAWQGMQLLRLQVACPTIHIVVDVS